MSLLLDKLKVMYSISKYSVLHSMRNKVLYIPVIFAVVFLIFSILIGEVALNEQKRFIINSSLITIQLISVFMAIVIGTFIFMEEIQKGILHVYLVKPISRGTYIFGKFLGGMLTIVINIIIMLIISFVVFYFQEIAITSVFFVNLLMILLESMIVLSLSILFSLSSSQLLSTFCVLCIWITGHTSEYFKLLVQEGSGFGSVIGTIAYRIIPDLEKLNYKRYVVYNIVPDMNQVNYAFLYAVLFSGLILMITTIILNKRDIK